MEFKHSGGADFRPYVRFSRLRPVLKRFGWRGELFEFVVGSVCEILESRVFALPEQLYFADRAIALLGDDDLSTVEHFPRITILAFLFFLVGAHVIVLAMDEHDHVGVLFDGARFPKVAE